MTNSGVFFFVVGPSGVGKDTLIDGAKAALAHDPDFVFATRTITRPSGAPGEAHVGVTAEEFAALDTAQRFLITWQAHGLHYGLPVELKDALARGQHVIANGSRAVIGELAGRVARFVVIEVSALASALAARIAERGRETEAEIAARLARSVAPIPAGVVVSRVVNDSSIEVGVARFIAALRDAANQYAGYRTSEPASASAYRAKLAGVTLDETGYAALIDDLSNDRYSSADSREILRTLISQLQDKEVVALARVRGGGVAPPRLERANCRRQAFDGRRPRQPHYANRRADYCRAWAAHAENVIPCDHVRIRHGGRDGGRCARRSRCRRNASGG
jgi:thymidine phosphorylase